MEWLRCRCNLLALINQKDDRMAITVYPMVLRDHRQSWDLTKALVAVADHDALRGYGRLRLF